MQGEQIQANRWYDRPPAYYFWVIVYSSFQNALAEWNQWVATTAMETESLADEDWDTAFKRLISSDKNAKLRNNKHVSKRENNGIWP